MTVAFCSERSVWREWVVQHLCFVLTKTTSPHSSETNGSSQLRFVFALWRSVSDLPKPLVPASAGEKNCECFFLGDIIFPSLLGFVFERVGGSVWQISWGRVLPEMFDLLLIFFHWSGSNLNHL